MRSVLYKILYKHLNNYTPSDNSMRTSRFLARFSLPVSECVDLEVFNEVEVRIRSGFPGFITEEITKERI